MEITAAKRKPSTGFARDVGELFKLFAYPRMEYYSREHTGFWENVDSREFSTLFLSQYHKNIVYVIEEWFPEQANELREPIADTLGTSYMHGSDEVSVTLYYKAMQPAGIRVTDEFVEGENVAILSRSRTNQEAFAEPEVEVFDSLYGEYTKNRTDEYDRKASYGFTLSIRNCEDTIEFSVKPRDYSTDVFDWVPTNPTLLGKVLRVLGRGE